MNTKVKEQHLRTQETEKTVRGNNMETLNYNRRSNKKVRAQW
jgi:hypothetical protein